MGLIKINNLSSIRNVSVVYFRYFMMICSVIIFMLLQTQPSGAYNYRWNMKAIKVNELHSDEKKRGKNVKVGVFDGLVNSEHIELEERCYSREMRIGLYDGYDSHGTHVATTIAGSRKSGKQMVGVAPKTIIYNEAVFDVEGWVGNEKSSIRYVREKGVSAINLSYGPLSRNRLFNKDDPLPYTMASLKNTNIVFMKSAGNDGGTLKSLHMSDGFEANQSLQNLMIVGSVDRKLKISDFSNIPGNNGFIEGSRNMIKKKNKYKYFFIVAPGENILAGGDDGRYMSMSGTSMATPHVTGAVALLHGYWPVLKKRAGATANILFHTATDLGKEGVDRIYGWGLLNIKRALQPLGETYISSNNKRYSMSLSRLSVSAPLASSLSNKSISFFDEYDRDYQISLSEFDQETPHLIESWVTRDIGAHETVKDEGPGFTHYMLAGNYNPDEPDIRDLDWRISYQQEEQRRGLAFQFGYGEMIPYLFDHENNTFGLTAERTRMSGAYPVLSLADGGMFGIIGHPLGRGFYFQAGILSNTVLNNSDRDSEEPYRADAHMVSISHLNSSENFFVSITVSHVKEKDSLLGTMGTGGLQFTDGYDSYALTLTGNYRLNENYKIFTTYTKAFSHGYNINDGLMSILSDQITSSSFSLGLERKSLFNSSDSLRFSISQPLRVGSGQIAFHYDDYYDELGILHKKNALVDLEPSGRQIDYQAQYCFSPKSDIDMAFFVYYSEDYQHMDGVNDSGIGIKISKSF